VSTPPKARRPLVISCAFALAEAFFSACAARYAQLLLTGRIDVWPGYWDLDESDRQRLCDLLRQRGDDLSSEEVFAKAVRTLGAQDALDGYRVNNDTVQAVHGLTPRAHADRLLTRLKSMGQHPALPAARPGRYYTTVRTSPAAEGVINLTDVTQPRSSPLAVTDAPYREHVQFDAEDLRKMAERIDLARGESHHHERVDALLKALVGPDPLRIRSGGVTQTLVAPTGFGKSVLLEVIGTLAVEQGVRTALVVPTRAGALGLAHRIAENLALLAITGSCAPLISPKTAMADAEKFAKIGDAFGDWAYNRLAYGCALPAATETEESVDAWVPGHEPCRELRLRHRHGRRHTCPWRDGCGKFRLMREATGADVIVTAHATFFMGSMHIPLRTDAGISDKLPVEEFIARRCQLIVIDEVDQFQRSVISRSARHLELARGRHRTAVHRLDDEFRSIFGHVLPESDGEVRAVISELRLLSEQYIANLAKGWMPPAQQTRRRYRTDHWLVPRGHDAWLTARLLGLGTDERRVTRDEVEALHALVGAPDVRPVPPLALACLDPVRAEQVREEITRTLREISSGCRAGTLAVHKIALSEALREVVPDDATRGLAVDRLIRRAHLEPLRRKLSELFYHTPHLGSLGADAAETIADALGGFSRWEAMPASPLGRLFFAFKERFDEERPAETMLSVAAFGGDPHGYVRYLGELTSRGHAGAPRAVLGLSATSFMPAAPHHHVFCEPTWFVPDTDTSGVTIHDARVFTGEQAIRISGVQGRLREQQLADAGEGLYRLKLAGKLRELTAARDERGTSGRDRILVATTSYAGVLTLAEGMLRAGAPAGSLCLLSRSDDEHIVRDPRWHVLAADQAERFPATGADILLAPLAVVERGANILDGEVSALGAIYMVVRPVPILDEPAELLAHIDHRLWSTELRSATPLERAEERMKLAGGLFEELIGSPQYFRSLPEWVQLGIVAEIIIGLVQLVGRARRGGTPGELYLVDDAFFDPRGRSDLPRLIVRLRERWQKAGHLDRLLALYGPTLEAFFDFATRMSHLTTGDAS
jgi:hypothetical protein